jgi:hypothetical protein
MYVLVPEGKAADILRDKIIYNDGEPVEGTFTFIVSSEVCKTLGSGGILKSFSLK